jgi:hypothetical protein
VELVANRGSEDREFRVHVHLSTTNPETPKPHHVPPLSIPCSHVLSPCHANPQFLPGSCVSSIWLVHFKVHELCHLHLPYRFPSAKSIRMASPHPISTPSMLNHSRLITVHSPLHVKSSSHHDGLHVYPLVLP